MPRLTIDDALYAKKLNIGDLVVLDVPKGLSFGWNNHGEVRGKIASAGLENGSTYKITDLYWVYMPGEGWTVGRGVQVDNKKRWLPFEYYRPF